MNQEPCRWKTELQNLENNAHCVLSDGQTLGYHANLEAVAIFQKLHRQKLQKQREKNNHPGQTIQFIDGVVRLSQ